MATQQQQSTADHTTGHPSEDLLRRGYEAYHRGDVETVMGLFTDDIQWHEPGQSRISGDYRGKDEVLAFFDKKLELSEGTFEQEEHDVLANDEHAVGLLTLRAKRGDKTVETRTVQVWHVDSGRLAECWQLHADLYTWNDFWS